MQLPRFLVCDNQVEAPKEFYIFHTQSPRFLTRMVKSDRPIIDWIDPTPLDDREVEGLIAEAWKFFQDNQSTLEDEEDHSYTKSLHLQFPRFLVCENQVEAPDELYIFHTQSPRFVTWLEESNTPIKDRLEESDTPFTDWLEKLEKSDAPNTNRLEESDTPITDWIDPAPTEDREAEGLIVGAWKFFQHNQSILEKDEDYYMQSLRQKNAPILEN